MKIYKTEQVNVNDFIQEEYDVFICSSGREKRAPYLALKHIHLSLIKNKMVLCYIDRPVLRDKGNLEKFKQLRFQAIDAMSSDHLQIDEYLDKITSGLDKSIRILVDYSCMTKVWYGSIINFFCRRSFDHLIEVTFSYSPAAFEKSVVELPNTYIDLVPGFSSLGLPDINISLFIGLGHEKIRAAGLIEFLDLNYENIFLFHTSDNFSPKFSKEVLENNSEVIKSVGENNVISYDLNDLKQIESILLTMGNKLRINNRLAIAPLGPKPFSLISLIIAKKIPGINIFRVGAGEQGSPPIRKADTKKDPLLYKVSFLNSL